jgi:D-serine deaminase-like pyridoxal phosphate-dependent protein
MADWCREREVLHAPHVKTHMSPELLQRQLAAGSWGTTAATAWQARVQIESGSPRVMIANETLDGPGLRWLAARLAADPELEVLVFVDSAAGVQALVDAARAVADAVDASGAAPGGTVSAAGDAVSTGPAGTAWHPSFGVLVDLGVADGRAGVRTRSEAVELARRAAAADSGGVYLAGVAGYEGVIAHDRTPEGLADVRSYLRELRALAAEVAPLVGRSEGGVASAGGSLFYDLVADELAAVEGFRTVVRPGCYLVHDHGTYAHNADPSDITRPHLEPATEIWARVLSTPEPGLALADVGRRDASNDSGMPTILAVVRDGERHPVHPDVHATEFMDQHTFVSVPVGAEDAGGPSIGQVPRIGDVLVLGISHPCTTIDKWRAIAVVDDDATIVGAVRTRF